MIRASIVKNWPCERFRTPKTIVRRANRANWGSLMRLWIIGLAALLAAGTSQAYAENHEVGRFETITLIRGADRSLVVFDLRTGNSWISRIDSARADPEWRLNNRVFGTSGKLTPKVMRVGEAKIKSVTQGTDVLRGLEQSYTERILLVLIVHHRLLKDGYHRD